MWLKQNPGRIISPYQICKLMCPAYFKSSTAEILVNGFRKSGICPFNKNIFSDYDFVIERQRERSPPPNILQNNEEVTTSRDVLTQPQKQNEQTPSKQGNALKRIEAPKTNFVGTEDISPLPCHSGTPGSEKGRKPRQGSSYVITCTPHKDELGESMREQERKNTLKGKGRKPKLSSELAESNKKKILEVGQYWMTIRIWTLTMRTQNAWFATVYTLKAYMVSSGYVA
ncbi:hypothetical protein JTB14_006423 [Gonioctena quinquepunctata]|nr:hypothetical protein JTB14_006423 [Gonioctena quinquepunctata]